MVEKLKEDFSELLRTLQDQRASFSKLREYFESGKLSAEEIYLLKDVLEISNTNGLDLIHANMDTFLVHIIQNMSEKGLLLAHTWESLLMAFAWRSEALPDLEKILAENRQALEDSKQSAAVQDYLEKNPWKVDSTALLDYVQFLK